MKRLLPTLIFWAAVMVRLQAAENSVVLNIDPTPANPRNSEGSFATLTSGRILFIYTHFYGGAEDGSAARLVAIQSSDQGRTWSPPQTVLENSAGNNLMSVSLLRLKSGRLALFYLVKNSWIDCRPHMRVSADDGVTWSEPKLVVEAPGYFVLNNDRVIQTSTGRLIVPVGFHRSRATDPKSSRSFDGKSITMWYYSDDEGTTWRESNTWWCAPVACSSGLQEPGVVEIAKNRLLGWSRTSLGAQYGFVSSDNGANWSPPLPTELQSPTSPASIKRLPNSADLLAVFNDHSGQFSFVKGKRTPLVVAFSSDQGQTWPRRKPIEDDPNGWYCYTAIHFVDDAMLLGYCAGDPKVGGLNRLRIRRLSLDWPKEE